MSGMGWDVEGGILDLFISMCMLYSIFLSLFLCVCVSYSALFVAGVRWEYQKDLVSLTVVVVFGGVVISELEYFWEVWRTGVDHAH